MHPVQLLSRYESRIICNYLEEVSTILALKAASYTLRLIPGRLAPVIVNPKIFFRYGLQRRQKDI